MIAGVLALFGVIITATVLTWSKQQSAPQYEAAGFKTTSTFDFVELSAPPGNAPAGSLRLYADNTGTIMLSNSGGAYAASGAGTFVPYSGATGPVDLGAQTMTTTGTVTAGQVIVTGTGIGGTRGSIESTSAGYGYGVWGLTASGQGLRGSASEVGGYAVYGTAAGTSGWGGYFQATGDAASIGLAGYSTLGLPLLARAYPGTAGDIVEVLRIDRRSSVAATANTGGGINFYVQDDAGNFDLRAQIAGLTPTATSGAEVGAVSISTRDAGGSLTERLRLSSAGLENMAKDATGAITLSGLAGSAIGVVGGTGTVVVSGSGGQYRGYSTGSVTVSGAGASYNGYNVSSGAITLSGLGAHWEGYKADTTVITQSGAGSHREGANTNASGTNGAHAEGNDTTASGSKGAHAEGANTVASGSNGAHAEGYYTIASATSAHAGGCYSNARLPGAWSRASGRFATTGDAQETSIVIRNNSADATPVTLYPDGSGTEKVTIQAAQTVLVEAWIAAAGIATGDVRRNAAWKLTCMVTRPGIASTTALVESAVVTLLAGTDDTAKAWTVTATADTTNGALNITFTGDAAHKARVVAKVVMVEVGMLANY